MLVPLYDMIADGMKTIVSDREIPELVSDALKSKVAVLGVKRSLRAVKLREAKFVVISASCPSKWRDDLLHYSKLAGIPIYTFRGSSLSLGSICHKPYRVSAIAVLRKSKKRVK